MKRILIAEDDSRLNQGIKLALRKDYLCEQAFSLKEARELFLVQQFDLILLDVNFPDGNGMDYLLEIRKKSRVPVILLTVNQLESDIVTGLELGANDYITKPFSLMVLRARVQVWMREREEITEVVRSGDFYFDFHKMEFLYGNQSMELSRTEQRLLYCLLKNQGRNVSRAELIDEAWPGEEEFVEEHALTVSMNRLRKKLEECSGRMGCIKTVYGVGYLWMGA